MKRTVLISVLSFFLGSIVFAQDWVSFTKSNPESPIINVTQSTAQQVKYTAEVCGMFKNNLAVGGENYQRIEIPDAGTTSSIGEPELPFVRQLIAIPECENISLNINITGQMSFSNYNIYPSPDFIEAQGQNGGKYVEEVFMKNQTAYSQNIYTNGIDAEIISTGYMRGQKYAEIYLYPVQFNPVTKHINVSTNYEITLQFANPSSPIIVNTGIFNNITTNAMINYVSSGIKASVNDNVNGNGNVQWITLNNPSQANNIVADYLIICSNPFFEPNNPNSEVLRIANHRANYNGFDVAILNVDIIVSDGLGFFYEGSLIGDDTYKNEQRIRTCIRMIYDGANAQHTYDGKLGYVLLIGDSEPNTNFGMPTSYNHNYTMYGDHYPSDYYYTCVTNDQNVYDETGDLFIGRFCVDNNLQNGLTELQNVVNKTICYESEATFGGWRNEIGTMIHEDFSYYMTPFFSFIDNLIPSYFNADHIDATQPNTHETLYQVMNDGVGLFTYYGHGVKNGWSAGGYLDMSVLKSELANTHKAPIVHAIACETGWFDKYGDCFGENLVTYSGTNGFTGYLGAGRSVYANQGASISDPPNRFQEVIEYTIFHDLSHITGEYILESKVIYPSWCAGQYKYAFNYFGDPALNVMAQG
ncbi:MAG: hypothetical protein B7C24_12000 [Bacteroidetes bacterium 4572_77]|nr:MAG: hypothetical protein B7C24_12000 [Bacteroidetes bacterium 4572_77]